MMCVFTETFVFFFIIATSPTEIYTLSLHDALPISRRPRERGGHARARPVPRADARAMGSHPRRERPRSEEHTSELQSPDHLVCRLLLEKKKKKRVRIRRANDHDPHCNHPLILILST